MNKKLICTITAIAWVSMLPRSVHAQELVISGNGESSQSDISIAVSQNVNVQQSNQAQVENNTESLANTGSNSASNNTGETQITTGAIDSQTTTANQNMNQNVVANGPCSCDNTLSVKISGNGEGSTNQTDAAMSQNVSVTQLNNATITNTTVIYANTGKNEANNNSGNVTIFTGDIHAISQTNNSNINTNVSNLLFNSLSATVSVSGNGADSTNQVAINLVNNNTSFKTNNTKLYNNTSLNLNSGKNSANGNNGDVLIKTGDIFGLVTITNDNVNTNWDKVSCGCSNVPKQPPVPENPPKTDQPPTQPTPAPAPSNPDSGGPRVGGDSASSSSSQTTSGGISLPATGGYWMYLFIMIASIMFYLGWYLRLRSGRSPNFAFA